MMKVTRKPKSCMIEFLGKISDACEKSNQRLSTNSSIVTLGLPSLLAFGAHAYPVDPQNQPSECHTKQQSTQQTTES